MHLYLYSMSTEKFYLHIGVTYEKNVSAKNKTEKQSSWIQKENEFGSRQKNYKE